MSRPPLLYQEGICQPHIHSHLQNRAYRHCLDRLLIQEGSCAINVARNGSLLLRAMQRDRCGSAATAAASATSTAATAATTATAARRGTITTSACGRAAGRCSAA